MSATRSSSPVAGPASVAPDAAAAARVGTVAGAGVTGGDHPLELTVHSMPSPRELQDDPRAIDPARTRRGRAWMLIVLALCAAPVVASYLTYYVIRPEGRRNFGELVDPQRPLPAWTGLDAAGRPFALKDLRGQWLLVTVAGGACDAACEKNLYLQRQLREGLGREKERMDRVWLIDDAAPARPALGPALKDAVVLRVDRAQLAAWLAPAAGAALEDHLYLIDPIGNWMMRLPARLDAAGAAKAKRDLDRMLRAAGSWDEPGRTTGAVVPTGAVPE